MTHLEIFRRRATALSLIGCFLLSLSGAAGAHNPKVQLADDVQNQVGFDQKLDQQLPLGLAFRDETGKNVQLRQYFGTKPVIILPIYYRCSMLCPIGADEMLRSLKQVKPSIGSAYNVLTLSIDPKETPDLAAEFQQKRVTEYGRGGVQGGWHSLTGTHEAIDALTKAIGFRYVYVEKTGEYAHPDGFVIATPEGKVARYFYRLDYPARDVQFGLMEASRERIGSPLTYLALSCFHYNPETGKYNFSVMKALRLFSAVFVVLMVSGIAIALRYEKKNASAAGFAENQDGEPGDKLGDKPDSTPEKVVDLVTGA